MSVLFTIPEYAEWAHTWSPEQEDRILSQSNIIERAIAGELSIEEELYLLNAARACYPAEFAWFCKRVLEGLTEEHRQRIKEEYELRQELHALQREQRMRAILKKSNE